MPCQGTPASPPAGWSSSQQAASSRPHGYSLVKSTGVGWAGGLSNPGAAAYRGVSGPALGVRAAHFVLLRNWDGPWQRCGAPPCSPPPQAGGCLAGQTQTHSWGCAWTLGGGAGYPRITACWSCMVTETTPTLSGETRSVPPHDQLPSVGHCGIALGGGAGADPPVAQTGLHQSSCTQAPTRVPRTPEMPHSTNNKSRTHKAAGAHRS